MKLSKNIIGKRYILVFILIIILISTITGIITIMQNKKYQEQINEKVEDIIGEIIYQYPDINEEQIVKILNESGNREIGRELLEEYGISDEYIVIENLERIQKVNIVINVLVSMSIGVIFIIIFVIYLKHRQVNIDKLNRYIQKVSKGDYLVNISENSEDELSSLKNSLYKITVMLKEESENKKKQNEAILSSVSDISHQLKTPLTSMQILIDNILDNPQMDESTKRKFITEISKQIKEMNFLILALLKLSKLDAGVVEFDKEKISLNNIINDTIDTLDVLIELKQIKIIKNFKSNSTIIGDYNWNKEAILNIVKNAVEHTSDNKTVTITLDENSVYTSITIKDEGEGIKEKELKNIFNRFYKTENSNENSIGIGLSLAKSIIEKQNGHITVDSIEGQGTTFKIKYLK